MFISWFSCVSNEKLISAFRGTYNSDDGHQVTLYAYLKAFRFTGSPALYLECDIHMCHQRCPVIEINLNPIKIFIIYFNLNSSHKDVTGGICPRGQLVILNLVTKQQLKHLWCLRVLACFKLLKLDMIRVLTRLNLNYLSQVSWMINNWVY